MQADPQSKTIGNRNGPAPSGGWLNRNVFGMGLTSLLCDAGHEMATAVLAGFLTVIGAPVYSLGIIEGVADAMSSFVKLGAGWWSDRIGHRKAITTAGYALTGGAFVLFAVAVSWPLVLLGRIIAWFGRGIRGPLRDAMLAESVAPSDRGKAFGFHRAGDTLGAIIGPLVAAGLMFLLQPYYPPTGTPPQPSSMPFRIIFLLTVVPGLGSAVAFALMVKEKRRPANHAIKFWTSVRALPTNFRRFLVGVGVFGAGDFSHTLLILAATQLLTASHGAVTAAQIAALLYALRNVFYAAASYPVGALGDRFSRRGLLFFGYLLGVVVMVGFIVAFLTNTSSILWLGVLFALAGVYIAVEDALEGVLTADLVPDESNRGTAYGVMGTVNGIGDFLSSVVVGLLWVFSPEIGFAYAAVAMLLGAALLQRVR
ncbi:MAG: MFS transporter [Phycisphaerae bacterium]|nr:MFS transporter [Phycisphaerae bacterium]